MLIPEKFQTAFHLAIFALVVAVVSHLLGQSHDITFIAVVIAIVMTAFDWLITPRKGE